MTDTILNQAGAAVLKLQDDHIDSIIELMNKEGWYYYDHQELKRYLLMDQDCFTLLKDGRVAGSIFTTNYGSQVWIGNIIVAEEFRGMGLAGELIRNVIDYIHKNKHVATFRLGSVPLAIGLYKKLGFHPESFTTAQQAELPLKIEFEEIDLGETIQVERMNSNDLEAICEIDERYFKSDRRGFLTVLYNDSLKESCYCLK